MGQESTERKRKNTDLPGNDIVPRRKYNTLIFTKAM